MKLTDEIKIYLKDADDESLTPLERQSSLNEIRAHAPTWLSQLLQEREVMVEALNGIYEASISIYPNIRYLAADLQIKAYDALKKVGEID